MKAKVRLMSSALTATLADPIVSFVEDTESMLGAIMAVLAPILVVVIAAVAALIGIRWWILRREGTA